MCFLFVTYSVSQSRVQSCLYFGLYLRNIAFPRKCYKTQNICMLNMFTLSLCNSLSHSVKGIHLFIFCLSFRFVNYYGPMASLSLFSYICIYQYRGYLSILLQNLATSRSYILLIYRWFIYISKRTNIFDIHNLILYYSIFY